MQMEEVSLVKDAGSVTPLYRQPLCGSTSHASRSFWLHAQMFARWRPLEWCCHMEHLGKCCEVNKVTSLAWVTLLAIHFCQALVPASRKLTSLGASELLLYPTMPQLCSLSGSLLCELRHTLWKIRRSNSNSSPRMPGTLMAVFFDERLSIPLLLSFLLSHPPHPQRK